MQHSEERWHPRSSLPLCLSVLMQHQNNDDGDDHKEERRGRSAATALTPSFCLTRCRRSSRSVAFARSRFRRVRSVVITARRLQLTVWPSPHCSASQHVQGCSSHAQFLRTEPFLLFLYSSLAPLSLQTPPPPAYCVRRISKLVKPTVTQSGWNATRSLSWYHTATRKYPRVFVALTTTVEHQSH